jgi:serine/threonine protein kinase
MYPVNIYSLASLDGCMIFLPKYGLSLDKYKYSNINVSKLCSIDIPPFALDKEGSHILERDICIQVMKLHASFIVHNDIKPSNIVNTQNIKEDTYRWRIIDFGLSETHILSNPGRLYFEKGTRGYNIPKFTKDIDNLSENEKIFWMYMKDWYGVSKTFSKLKNGESKTFSELNNEEDFKLNKEFEKPITLSEVVGVVTKGRSIEIEYLYMYIDDMELSMILKVLENLRNKYNIEETPHYLIV